MANVKSGFSLIELLITLAIIGILVGLAYPRYNQHLITVRRTYAIAALTDVAARLEQYYAANNTYAGATLNNLGVPEINFYQLQITQATADQYSVSAIPQKQQAQDDSDCGTLILDQEGNKKITGKGKIATCWEQN